MDLPADRLTPERKKMLRRIAVVAFVLFPLVLPSNYANMGVRAAIWVLALLSLVVLTGWVGQVSLAQAAFMGIGAFSAAQASRHLGLDYPWHAFVAGAFAAGTALLIGMAALRIRGLYLAIATLAFQWMMEASFLEWHPISGGFNGVGIDPLKFGPYDFSSDRLFFYLAWGTAFLVLVLTANLRDSKTGRAWFAIRGSEIAAKTLGIDVTRYKLTAFAVSGFIVGVAGSLNLNFIGQATPFDYNFTKSITYLGVAVLGGIGAIAGAVVGAFAFVISDQLVFTSIDALRGKIDIAAAGLLIFTILRNPGGLITMAEDIKERIAMRRARLALRADPLPVSGGAGGDPATDQSARLRTYVETRGERSRRLDTPPVLVARDVTIRFGGVVANNEVNLEVRRGEICGLIGPNGAGKTTFFNAVNGLLVPNDGTVFFGDADVTAKPIHERAAMGMSRTFQIMRLVTRLTVFENCMIATHLQNHSGFLDNMLMRRRSVADDRRNAERVREILSFLGIAEHADRKISSLPFGILRLVELGRALVTQPKLLLLDEPASGLDVRETDAFAEHLFRIRDEMGHTVLLIEHDMRLVMMVADYVYVLEFGRNLAEGLPSSIQRNKAVIAAYLGEEAVA